MKITNLSLSIKTEKLITKSSFAIDVDQGLSLQHKAISSKYFYDDIALCCKLNPFSTSKEKEFFSINFSVLIDNDKFVIFILILC